MTETLHQKVDRLSELVAEVLEQNHRLVDQNDTLMNQVESIERDQYFNARRDSAIGEQYIKLCSLVLATYNLIDSNVSKKQLVLCSHTPYES